MSFFSPLDRDLALVYSPLLPVPFRDWLLDRGMALVEVPDEEFPTMACNVLALDSRRCLMLDGNPVTRERLEAAACEPITYDGSAHLSYTPPVARLIFFRRGFAKRPSAELRIYYYYFCIVF
jgi:N-dimethylarginine dimethylaminohydrolase